MTCPYHNSLCEETNVSRFVEKTRCHGEYFRYCHTYIQLNKLYEEGVEHDESLLEWLTHPEEFILY